MSKIKKIAAGHYASDKGRVENVYSVSGAPHTRNTRAKWLVTLANGRSFFVPSLRTAREYLV